MLCFWSEIDGWLIEWQPVIKTVLEWLRKIDLCITTKLGFPTISHDTGGHFIPVFALERSLAWNVFCAKWTIGSRYRSQVGRRTKITSEACGITRHPPHLWKLSTLDIIIERKNLDRVPSFRRGRISQSLWTATWFPKRNPAHQKISSIVGCTLWYEMRPFFFEFFFQYDHTAILTPSNCSVCGRKWTIWSRAEK